MGVDRKERQYILADGKLLHEHYLDYTVIYTLFRSKMIDVRQIIPVP